jgi:curved DNA-binding protein CbpA
MVKTVHPDTKSGDKERFKDVKAAYERLVEE